MMPKPPLRSVVALIVIGFGFFAISAQAAQTKTMPRRADRYWIRILRDLGAGSANQDDAGG